MNPVPVIDLRDVTVTYDRRTANSFTALRSLSLTVMKGETVVITGDNGSGKSTLLKALAGTVPIASGRIFIRGVDISNWAPHRRAKLIGLIHQDPMLGTCPNLTVHENAQLYTSRQWWWPFPDLGATMLHRSSTLATFGSPLELKAALPMKTLSGGQRQGAAIALALSSIRPILLMDEFTSSLDRSARALCFRAIEQASRARDLTILAVAHDLAGFEDLNARIVSLRDGAIIEM